MATQAPIESNVIGTTPPSVEAFNDKIASLLKQSDNKELIEILRSPSSVVSPMHNNVNNN